MFGAVSEEAEVKVPMSKAWELYGTLGLSKIVAGDILEAIDVEEGDGGTGTLLKLTLHPGSGFKYCKEKFTKVDNENKVKEVEIVEGGFLDIGFTLYRVRFEIKENPNDDSSSSCVVKMTFEYEVKEEAAANAYFPTKELIQAVLNIGNEHLLKSN